MEDKVIYARDIDDCSVCPLCQKDCKGGWTSNGSGTPIEPPCTSWNGDEEIYEGMYDYDCDYWDYEYAEVSYKEKQTCEQEARERQRKEYLERRMKEQNYINEALNILKQEYENFGTVNEAKNRLKNLPIEILEDKENNRIWIIPTGEKFIKIIYEKP